jgi:hypothetical protein
LRRVKKVKKKLIALLTALTLVFAFGGCVTPRPGPDPEPPDNDYTDYVKVEGAGFDADESYKLASLDLTGDKWVTAGTSDTAIDSVSLANARGEMLEGGGIRGIGEAMNASLVVSTYYESYPGTVIEFEATVTKSLFNVFFHSQTGSWSRENYMLQLNTEGLTNRTVKFAKYIETYTLFSNDPAVEYLTAKHKYRLVIGNSASANLAELYILEQSGPRDRIARDAGAEFYYYSAYNGLSEYGPRVSQSEAVNIPLNAPYLKALKDVPLDDAEPVYNGGYIGFAFSCSAVLDDSASELHSFKIYTPLSAVKAAA